MSVKLLVSDKSELAQVHRFSFHELSLEKEVLGEEAALYSRMKYGDPESTREIADRSVAFLLNQPALQELPLLDKPFFLASSAYGAIPTAANAVTRCMVPGLRASIADLRLLKFERQGGFGCSNYAELGVNERKVRMRQRKVSLPRPYRNALKGQTLVVFDDLRSSGSHEMALYKLLREKSEVKNIIFLYWMAFSPELSTQNPQKEDFFNHSEIKTLGNLADLYAKSPIEPFLNARVVKFILKGGRNGQSDVQEFLYQINPEIALAIYQAAKSKDGYAFHPEYRQGFKILQRHLFQYSL